MSHMDLCFLNYNNKGAWWWLWWTETCSQVLCLMVHFLCISFTVKTTGWIWINIKSHVFVKVVIGV